MIYSQAEPALRALTGSSTRAKILMTLRDGPQKIRPLAEAVGVASSNVLNSIAGMWFEEKGLYRIDIMAISSEECYL